MITTNIDKAREKLDASSEHWTGPHPDFALHVIGVMLEAAGRDVVQAITDMTTDVTKAIREVADSIE